MVRKGTKSLAECFYSLREGRSGKVFEKRCKIVIQEGEDKCNVIRQCCIYEQSHIHGLKPDVGCKCVSPEKYGSAGMGSRKEMPGFPQYEV